LTNSWQLQVIEDRLRERLPLFGVLRRLEFLDPVFDGVQLADLADGHVNDHLNGAIPGSVYWSHPGIGLMEPPQDRPIGAT
jgi:hypothetical protein